MKRNIHIITILAVVITMVSVLSKNENKHVSVFSNKGINPSGYIAPIDTVSQHAAIFNSAIYQGHSNSKAKNYDDKNNTGNIGITDNTLFDNPKDNTFDIKIDKEITENSVAYLEYDLYGVQDYASVCRGINDNLSFGGVVVKKSNKWTSQSEKIPASQLKSGSNKILFAVQPGNNYGYTVKNVRIRIEDGNNTERSINLCQAQGHDYYGQEAYISGYVTGTGADKVRVYADGILLKTYNTQFEGLINKPDDKSGTWSTTIKAVFDDGQVISENLKFEHQSPYDYKSECTAAITFCEKLITKESAVSLMVSGFSLDGGVGSVENNRILSVTGLRGQDMQLLSPDMINVTAQHSGYRCLPHGSLFSKNLKIRIKYDTSRIPQGYGPENIRTYYYDENAKSWLVLELDSIDRNTHEIISYTNHFTDFVNSILKTPEAPLTQSFTPTSMKDLKFADPMAGYNIMEPPVANNNGTANLSFPIELPKGRQGMQPQLAISYNSDGGDGWLGVGWNLDIPAITVETRWGVPHYFSGLESESYLINGEQIVPLDENNEILPLVHRGEFIARNTTNERQFKLRVEGAFDKIIRHGTLPSNYWWEIIDKQGVKYIYGKYNSDNAPNPNCVLTDGNENIAHWALAEVRDLNDNFVKYVYTVITDNVNPGAGGKQIYPQTIEYTGFENTVGKYKVDFEIDNSIRPDYTVSGRYGFIENNTHLLNAIGIYYDDQFIRGYVIKYKTGAYNKKLICTITDIAYEHIWDYRNTNGDNCDFAPGYEPDELLPKIHRFDYYSNTDQSFSDPNTISNSAGGADLRILKGAVNISGTPAISKSLTTGWSIGGSLNIGLGAKIFKKNNSIGGSYNYNESKTKDYLIFEDINGDGLPDRTYKKDGDIYFKKLYFNNGQLTYGDEEKIEGLPSIGKSNNHANIWGIEGQLLIFAASASWTKTHNYNSSYFADVNADGYPDYIDDGTVYYNATYNEQYPSFIEETDAEIQQFMGSPCNFIIRSGQVNDSVYTEISDKGDYQYSYSRDPVRVWVAPYNGNITVNSNIQLIEDTTYSRRQSRLVDGVIYTIQHSASEIKRESISASDYSVHSWNQSNISVTKGDKIYFRLQAKADRKWDDVKWNPSIYYSYINGVATDTNVLDADGKKIALFRPSEDLLINNKQIFQAPYSGKVRLRGTLNFNNVSDTVHFKIIKGTTTIRQVDFASNTSVSYYVNDTLSVSEDESINLIASTNTNINWNKFSNDFKIYYYFADSVEIDTNSSFNKIEVRPMLQFNIYQNTMQVSKPYTFTPGNYLIRPQITATTNPNINGEIILAIKTGSALIKKIKIHVINGTVYTYNTIATLPSGNIYFEYYCNNDLSDFITSAWVDINTLGNARDAGLNCMMPDTLWKFGNLYRGWGQFSYNDKLDTNNSQPINEVYLHFSSLCHDTTLITFDTTSMIDFSSARTELSADGQNDPLNEHFNMMFPDLDSMVYRDYAREAYVGKNKMSASIMMSDSVRMDTTYDSPLIISTNPYSPVRSIRKTSIEKNFAYSISATLGLSIGYSYNSTTSKSELEYMDLNGDRYPDIVGTENVQFTMPQGGFFDNIYEGVLSGSLENSEYTGDGNSYGVNLPFAAASNVPSFSTFSPSDNASSSKYFKTVVEKGGNLSLGTGTYEGYSDASFILRDINGDGLPDKIHNSGEVNLNLGYKFGITENWGLTDFNLDFSSSESYNIGGGSFTNFNNSQYSWSGGISLSLSETDKSLALADMNNDGLLDVVSVDGSSGNMTIILNNGHGFPSSTTTWSNNDDLNAGKSISGSVYLAGSAGITFGGLVKIVGNLQGSLSGSVNCQKIMLIDFNNDGYADIVSLDEDNNILVRYSNMGKINLLKKVTTSSWSNYNLDYTLSTCDQDMPQRRLLMTSLKVFDGFVGDGIDTTYKKFYYAHGYYDRFERTFLGFDSVNTMQYNNFTPSGFCYRSTIEKYHNNDFLFKGIKFYDVILEGTSTKYIETFYKYDRKEDSSGKVIPPDSAHCFGPYYPAISKIDKYFYEGTSTVQIHTQVLFEHGKYGNVKKHSDLGDTTTTDDDLISSISYKYDTTKNLLSMADTITIKNHINSVLRKRFGSYDINGQITQISIFYDGNNTANTNINYDTYGNIEDLILPPNNDSDRMEYHYNYDDTIHTYPISVGDKFGNKSYTDYNFRLGLPTIVKDISGNEMRYTYYEDGRVATIKGPKEIQSGAPYTLKFVYGDQNFLPVYGCNKPLFAKTYHFDPLNQGNRFFTFSMSDGLGRPIQTKQKVTIGGMDSLLVSGKVDYDAFGRIVKTYNPVTEDLYQSTSCQYAYDSIPFYYDYNQPIFSITNYDILNRVVVDTAPDQTVVNYAYGFDNDAFGVKRFKTIITDPLNKVSTSYADPRGLKTSVTNPLSTITKFVYNALGELIETKDPEDNPTTYLYDLMGKMTQREHPDAGTTSYTFDPAGNLLTTQTENLYQNNGQKINYEYDYNRLVRVVYPDNPENNVYYEYGDANTGNQSGKITRMQDASGTQEFYYGNMGEITRNFHTFVVPNGSNYTFEMNWEYDSWNRLINVEYPDGELVSYYYDNAGKLKHVNGINGSDSYNYIDSITYNLYGSRSRVVYGNGTRANYYYHPLNQLLTNLTAFDIDNNEIQNIFYVYDDSKNISTVTNTGDYTSAGLGGEYEYNYIYDDLYRLADASGSFDSYNNGSFSFETSMEYSASGNITNKDMAADLFINGSAQNLSYSNGYSYNDRPHTVTQAGNYMYEWDNNGNLIYRTDNNIERYLCWDEENRLTTVRDITDKFPYLSSYIYNAGGERTWKLTGEQQQMWINGQGMVNSVQFDKTLYDGPYMTLTDKEYTKHIYIEGERICSKIGGGFGNAPNDIDSPISQLVVDHNQQSKDLWELVVRGVKCTDFNPEYLYMESKLGSAENHDEGYEDLRYFYHSDHLGSSSFITDAGGNAVQHLQYLPFGETFIDERTDAQYNTPYKFSGKEKDDETQYSYFGARYYDSDLSVWLSVDPLAGKYLSLSPYVYCANNPVILVDPDGRSFIVPNDYFSESGEYLFSDKLSSNNIYIVKSGLMPKPILFGSYQFTKANSYAVARIAQHYSKDAGVDINNLQNRDFSVANFNEVVPDFGPARYYSESWYNNGQTGNGYTNLMTGGNNKISIILTNGYIPDYFNNKYNFIVGLSHENNHNLEKIGGIVGEMLAYCSEINSPYWSKTTSEYRENSRVAFNQYYNDAISALNKNEMKWGKAELNAMKQYIKSIANNFYNKYNEK